MVASITALEIPCEMNSLLTAPRVTAPAVFIISGADTLIPPKYQMMVVDAYAGKKRLLVLPNAGHTTPIELANQSRLRAMMKLAVGKKLAVIHRNLQIYRSLGEATNGTNAHE